MILLYFTFCSSSNIHYFSFDNSATYFQHNVVHDISKLGEKLKFNDQIFLLDSNISNKDADILFNMITDYSYLSLTITGFSTKIIFKTKSRLKLKDGNITIQNMTFANCDSVSFNFIDSSINLYNIHFLGNGYLTNDTFLNFVNCTSTITRVYFENHNRPLIFSNSSILFSLYLFFDNITAKSLDKPVMYLFTSSFESSYTKLINSSVSHLIFLDNSNVFISHFKNIESYFSSILIHSIFSNILIRYAFFKKCHGPILSSINDSTFHISNIIITDHISEYPLFTVINATLSVFDSQFLDSEIDSIATIKSCSTFYFTNSSIFYVMTIKTLFELQKTNSAEFSQITIYRLVSQSDIGIIHAISSDYAKISQTSIQGFVSQSSTSTALVFSDVSSIYLDDFNYTRNGVSLMIVKQANVVCANSYISKNDCIEYSNSESVPSSFITLLTESSLHFINSQFLDNSVSNGFSLLALDSLIFFMKVTFSRNDAPIHLIQSDIKFSKSVFKYNSNRVIESQFSNVNIHKCLFSSGKKLQIFIGNESKIIVNTTIVNSSRFIEADSSAYSITIGSGRFLYSYKKAINFDAKRTKLSLFDTKFNCSVECEKMQIKSDVNFENNLVDNDVNNDENQLIIDKSQNLLKNVRKILTDTIENKNDHVLNNENESELSAKSGKNHQPKLNFSASPFLKPPEKKLIQNENNSNLEIENFSLNSQNSSIINLPNPQINLGYQVCVVILPIFFLFSIFIYRFKSSRFRRVSKRIFSQKGRYQL